MYLLHVPVNLSAWLARRLARGGSSHR